MSRSSLITILVLTSATISRTQTVSAPPPVHEVRTTFPVVQPGTQIGPLATRSRAARSLPSPIPTSNSTLREPAEDSSGITTDPASPVFAIVQSSVVAAGTNAFHLANPGFEDHAITLTSSVTPTAQSKLTFLSRLRYATSSQHARLQISVDAGPWATHWTRTGTGDSGQSSFELITVDLGTYEGQSLQFRFLYEFTGGSAYVQTNTSVGWFIDHIQVGDAYLPILYDCGDPTPQEILSLEMVNRARTNATVEALRLRNTTDPQVLNAINSFGVDLDLMESQFASLPPSLPPLAFNAKLIQAARLHSQDMYNNQFQDHTSSTTPVAPNQSGDNLGQRITRQGYSYSNIGESIYAYGKSAWHAHAGFNIDWGNGPGGMQTPAGHRLNIHTTTYKEIGIGVVEGNNGSVGPFIITQDFGRQGGSGGVFLTGVTHIDGNGDHFYDPGEGIPDVIITVESNGFGAVSSTHGAYVVPLPETDGTYTVTFSADGYVGWSTNVTVSNGASVKLDYRAVHAPGEIETSFLVNTGDFSITTSYGGAGSNLVVECSTNLVDWVPVSITTVDLGGGLYRLDASGGAGNLGMYRLSVQP